MAIPPVAALEIGTSRTVACIGEVVAGGRVRIIGIGCSPTTGVRKGLMIDLDQAREGVRHAVREAEQSARVHVRQVVLAVSGGHIQEKASMGMLTIRASDRVVRRKDMEVAADSADDIPIDNDRLVLHTLTQTWVLDDQTSVANPEGMRCNRLQLNKLAIHGAKTHIENALNVAQSVGRMEVSDTAFSGVCAAMAVLTPEQKARGVVLVDLGGGTTKYMAFADGILATAGCLAVGGDHVTNDIALAFHLSLVRAEEIKCKEGCAVIEADSGNERLTLPGASAGQDERQISRRMLNTVINARVDETFRVLHARLDEAGVLPSLGAGVVLTGGGAYLRRVQEQAAHVFGMPCHIGLPENVEGLDTVEQPASLATAAGLIIYGWKSYEGGGLLAPVVETVKRIFRR